MTKLSKLLSLVFAGLLLAAAVGCDSNGDNEEDDFSAEYEVELSGQNEVPEVETDATGDANLTVNSAGTSLNYTISVANIDSVTQAHIHEGPSSDNGGVVAFLYEADGEPESFDGSTQIASGTITEDDLVGPLEGESFLELVQLMRQGRAYVNVHTTANPAGEIRGQINSSGNDSDNPGPGDPGY